MTEQLKHVQLDEQNTVKAISWLSEDESGKGLIVIFDDIEADINYIYDPINQTFSPPDVQVQPDTEPKASIEEVAEETLLETKYQTFLLEMML